MPTAATLDDVIPHRHYTVSNVARILGYCRQTIRKWILTGKIESNNMDPPRIPGWQVKLMADPHGAIVKLAPQESAELRRKKAKRLIKSLI